MPIKQIWNVKKIHKFKNLKMKLRDIKRNYNKLKIIKKQEKQVANTQDLMK